MGFLDHFKITTNYGAVAVTAAPVIILGGLYLALAYIKGRTRKPVLTRSVSLGVLHGGKLALERLVHYHQARADAASLNDAETKLKSQLEGDRPDLTELQVTIAKLEMNGKATEAVKILKEKWNQAKSQKKTHKAYEIEMLLVEMLIYKGDFREADECECLIDKQITDARRPLFKAIIHIMLEDFKAVDYWNDFNEIRTQFQWPPGLPDSDIYEVIENFEKFEKVVKVLKTDIEANKKK